MRISKNDLKEGVKVKAIKLKTIDFFSVDNQEEIKKNEELGLQRKLVLEVDKCEPNVCQCIQSIFDDFYFKNRGKKKPNLFK